MADSFPVIRFRPGDLLDPIRDRLPSDGSDDEGSLHLVAKRDLERYYQLLTDELRQIHLSRDDALLICDAMNGTFIDHNTYRYLALEVQEAIALNGLAEKWDVDRESLVGRLTCLSPGGLMALADAVERFWAKPNPTDEALQRAGLVR